MANQTSNLRESALVGQARFGSFGRWVWSAAKGLLN
jgi:hypothetical protein